MSFVAAAVVAGAGVVSSVASANAQKSAAKKAANAQKQASDAQIALQREQLAYAKEVAQPYMAAGNRADAALDARWGGGGPSTSVDPYGAWGAALNARPGSAYDGQSGAPRATTARGAPQIARTVSWTPPAAQPQSQPQPQAPAQSGGWDWRTVDPSGLPPLPGKAPAAANASANPLTNWRDNLPSYLSVLR